MTGLLAFVLLVIAPITFASRSAYCLKVALGWDVLVSAYLNGKPGETLSGRVGSAYLEGKLRGHIFCLLINFIMRDPLHCQRAVRGDALRAQAVLKDIGMQC
jgi:hypothetical protein